MGKPVICRSCNKVIKQKNDLVTANISFAVVPYHTECYNQELKGKHSLFISKSPLNGMGGNIGLLISLLIVISVLIFGEPILKVLGLLIGAALVGFRFYSYVAYEKHFVK